MNSVFCSGRRKQWITLRYALASSPRRMLTAELFFTMGTHGYRGGSLVQASESASRRIRHGESDWLTDSAHLLCYNQQDQALTSKTHENHQEFDNFSPSSPTAGYGKDGQERKPDAQRAGAGNLPALPA